jgi:uncharacterized protein YciI
MLFAVTRTRGANWNEALPLEGQADWPAHADFMNALEAEGFVLLGGPLGGTIDALLIVRARDADEVRWRLAADPWVKMAVLREASVLPWTLRLGEDFATGWVSARARAKSQEKPRSRSAKANKSQGGGRRKANKGQPGHREKAKESQRKPRLRDRSGGGRRTSAT